jgi:glycosyltransferase involved in cell wall biosynthesis
MIVKDEEDCIGKCLESVKNVVDEIIIVDTGSTDNTVEICKKFNAKIEHFNWNNSFCDARNFSIEKAKGDWILWLDADEELDSSAQHILRQGTHFENYDVIKLNLINYQGEKVDINNSTSIAHMRLFKNNGLKFINKMHERIDFKNIANERMGHLEINVHHYGYLDKYMKRKNKSERNIKLLKQQIKENDNVYWAHYFIALEHYQQQQFKKALERVNQSIITFLSQKVLPPAMVYKLKYSILIAMGNYEMVTNGIDKAIMLYPDYVELFFLKGLNLYYLKKYNEAINCFEKCKEIGEDNLNYLILKGVGSFKAQQYIDECKKFLNI